MRFSLNNQKIDKVGKIRKDDEETEYFEKKNASIFLKVIFTKREGTKDAGGSRPFCF